MFGALGIVAYAGDIKLLSWLFAKKFKCIYSYQGLVFACQKGNLEAVKLMLPHIPTEALKEPTNIRTHIEIAAEIGRWDIVKIIAERLVQDNIRDDIMTTLLMAVEGNVDIAIIQLLIKIKK